MAETEETVKESCSILMISKDMEWMLAFGKGVQRFYLLNERRAETLEAAESRMLESRPDLVILAVQDGLPSMDKLRPIVREKMHPPVPVIVIDSKPEGLDQWIKQGAEIRLRPPRFIKRRQARAANHACRPFRQCPARGRKKCQSRR